MRAIAGTRLDPSDIESTTMGLSGVDVILTKAARDLFGPLAFECKNVELLNAVGVFQKHYDKYAAKGMVPIMVHSRNHIEPRVTMLWADFVKLYLSPVAGRDPAALRPTLETLRTQDAANREDYRGPRRVTTVPAIFAAPYKREVCPNCSHDNSADEHCGGPWHSADSYERLTGKPRKVDKSGHKYPSVTGNSYGLGDD